MKIYGQRFAIIPEFVLYADVSPRAKVLWAIYQRHADPMGGCYPSTGRLCELMGGVSPDTVQRAKQELLKAELIKAQPRHDSSGRQTVDAVWLAPLKPPKNGGGRAADLRPSGAANLHPSI